MSRLWFAVTAAIAFSAVVIQVIVAAGMPGHFTTPLEKSLNVFAFFTIQSNIIVGVTCLLLALRLERSSELFRMFRLSGVVAIFITGLVYHTLLAGLVDVHGWAAVCNQMLHTAVPLLGVLGWLLFGPRGLISWRTVALAFVFPLGWLAFTMIRGAAIHWYPYPFIDVDDLGYARVAVNAVVVAALFFGLAAAAFAFDRWALRRARPAG